MSMLHDSEPHRSVRGSSRRPTLWAAAATGAAFAAGFFVGTRAGRRASAAAPMTPPTPGPITFALTLNGERRDLTLEPRTTLLDALREDLHLTGTKKGCDHGQCGACTVLIDGERVLSCLSLAIMQRDRNVATIEGLADGETLHPVQQAFIDHDAFQCGYCTPGQICSAVGLIREGHARTDDDIREQMSGNLCRCAIYPNIVAAVRQALDQSKG